MISKYEYIYRRKMIFFCTLFILFFLLNIFFNLKIFNIYIFSLEWILKILNYFFSKMGMETTIDNTSSSSKQWTLDYFTGMKIHLCVCGLFQFFLLLFRMVNFWFWLSFSVCQCFSRKFSKKTFFIKERRKKNFFLVSISIYFQGENHSSFVRKLMCINSSFTRIFFSFWLHKIKWEKENP